jgi:hypothetical protein
MKTATITWTPRTCVLRSENGKVLTRAKIQRVNGILRFEWARDRVQQWAAKNGYSTGRA